MDSKKVAISPDGLSIQCDFKMARLKLHGRADSEETKRSHEIAKGKATNTNGKVGLGAVLSRLGAVLRQAWGSRGAVMGRLGAVLDHLGAVLGPSWGHLGSSWGRLGPSWDRLRLGPQKV